MKQEKLFDLLKAAVSPCECVKAAKQELLENGFEEIDYTGDWKLVRGGRYVLNHHDTTMFAFTVGSVYNKIDFFYGILLGKCQTKRTVCDLMRKSDCKQYMRRV